MSDSDTTDRVVDWRREVEPEAAAWRLLEERARTLGQVHALDALHTLQRGPGARCPADLADLVAAMVADGVLEPVAPCLAHPLGHSIRAFRGVGPSAGGTPSREWSRADAHVWTYRIPEGGERDGE